MITKENFKDVILNLEFVKEEQEGKLISEYYAKYFNDDIYLKVDFDNKILIYPEESGLKINTRTTCNFSQNENFVVFECIHRLFKQGYKPQHIELEPKWKMGHEQKSGRADILVKDYSNIPLLIIECKTARDNSGKSEFEKEWQIMKQDGGQLFSYLKEERNTKFICLYTSDFENNNCTYQNHIITTTDIQNLVEKFDKKLVKPMFYKDAANAKELFKAWKETYKFDSKQQGIFEDDVQAYNIGSKKITLNSLQYIGKQDIQNKFNEFAKILRQHNVSGRENAFDKLVNLFLCKIVDETENKTNLKFYWKGEYFDNYFELLDRLQHLYSIGMHNFLNDEVTYIQLQKVKEAFKFVTNDPDATQDAVLELFKKQKYFTNNDFSFIDVHNEKLFFQNADILLKIIKMWENFQINGEQQNQFLGDMFEGFLDKGVKQSEGQFFTPMPICKFIISSLPLDNLIKDNEKPPSVLDYACGAGHFLTEFAAQVKPLIEKYKITNEQFETVFGNESELAIEEKAKLLLMLKLKEQYKHIYGIEKEYRLSKVAKVSAFMYGMDEINILYADALTNNERIKEKYFDVLISNPPYSVKGFLETIENDRDNYILTSTIDPKSYYKSNSIETFFFERAKQLVKPKGIVGIILPTSILSKGSKKSTSEKENTYVMTREILIQNFEIIAIAEFGAGTFGKTGTTTVILFLRKRDDNPEPWYHYECRVNVWFKNDKSRDDYYEDFYLVRKYCEHIEIDFEDYKTLLEGNPSESLLNYDIFIDYTKDFYESKETIELKENFQKQMSNLENTVKSDIAKDINSTKEKLNENETEIRISELLIIKEKELRDEFGKEIYYRFVNYLKSIEKDKLYYFLLTYTQKQNVLIIKSPDETSEIKKMLGYEWSTRKGSEGIKYIGKYNSKGNNKNNKRNKNEDDIDDDNIISNIEALYQINTPLYDNENSQNPEKINYYIQQNFLGNNIEIPESLYKYVSSSRLVDMLDFKRKNFDKVISLNPKKTFEIKSKWEVIKIENIAETSSGGTPLSSVAEYYLNGTIPWVNSGEVRQGLILDTENKITEIGFKNSSAKMFPVNTVLVAMYGATAGQVGILGIEACTNQAVCGILPSDKYNSKYLFYYLSTQLEIFLALRFGVARLNLNQEVIKNFKLPLPPIEIQQKIVEECEKIDNNVEISNKEIENNKKNVEKLFNSVFLKADKIYRLSDETMFDVSIGKRVLQNEIEQNKDGLPVYSANVFKPFGYIKKQLIEDFTVPSVIWGIDGDWMVNFIPANQPFYPTDHCGFLRIKSDDIHYRYLAWVLNKEGLNARFSRANRASIDRIKGLEIKCPDFETQKQLVNEIEKIELEISKAEKIINEANYKKNEIIMKFLN